MPRQPVDANGNFVALWTTLEDAKKYRAHHYDCGDECPTCVSRGFIGLIARKRYVTNGACVHCATMNALELWSLASYTSVVHQYDGGLEYLVDPQNDGEGRRVSREYLDMMESALALVDGSFPTTRQGAIDKGVGLYIRDRPCRTHGHLGITTLKGECYYCEQERSRPSPRQQAIRDGKKWYLPTEPCPKCGQTAEKRVDNGQCRGCMAEARSQEDGRETADSVMMRECPDLVISRENARAAGFKVYRTGKPCRKGHAGYRYVSTGNCIECLRD